MSPTKSKKMNISIEDLPKLGKAVSLPTCNSSQIILSGLVQKKRSLFFYKPRMLELHVNPSKLSYYDPVDGKKKVLFLSYS